jgi:hypothetical protein
VVVFSHVKEPPMSKKDPRIDAYIAKLAGFAKPHHQHDTNVAERSNAAG